MDFAEIQKTTSLCWGCCAAVLWLQTIPRLVVGSGTDGSV